MEETVQPVNDELGNSVEIIVHITEDLDREQQQRVEAALKDNDGIVSAEFCVLRNHLVLTRYNRDLYDSQDVLKSFRSLDLQARLIGPI